MAVREAYRRGNVNMRCQYGASSLLSDIHLILPAFCDISRWPGGPRREAAIAQKHALIRFTHFESDPYSHRVKVRRKYSLSCRGKVLSQRSCLGMLLPANLAHSLDRVVRSVLKRTPSCTCSACFHCVLACARDIPASFGIFK
jgi:hypothetical protein